MRIAIVNLNLDAAEQQGCLRIAEALRELSGAAVVVLQPFAAVRAQPSLLDGLSGVVLGPQGTPFAAYDAGFLPWLHELGESTTVPVLGVCGGMQALALAYGGRLEATFGGAIGADYSGHRKLRGPHAVTLDRAALPDWLPAVARDKLQGWEAANGHVFESHVEQVADLPSPLIALAGSALTPVEALAHRDRPILASQFHPELGWQEGCGAGRLWLESWLMLLS